MKEIKKDQKIIQKDGMLKIRQERAKNQKFGIKKIKKIMAQK